MKQGGLFICIHPCSLRLNQSPNRNITEGEESCVKTLKGCVIDDDQNTVIDSNDDDEEYDESANSNKERNSESLEDMQDNLEARNQQGEEPENPDHTQDNAEIPDNSLNDVDETHLTILRNENEFPTRKHHIEYKIKREDSWQETIVIMKQGWKHNWKKQVLDEYQKSSPRKNFKWEADC